MLLFKCCCWNLPASEWSSTVTRQISLCNGHEVSKLRVARRTPQSATCFVKPWQPVIKSRRTWRSGRRRVTHLSLGKTELTALPCDMFTDLLHCYGDVMEVR